MPKEDENFVGSFVLDLRKRDVISIIISIGMNSCRHRFLSIPNLVKTFSQWYLPATVQLGVNESFTWQSKYLFDKV